MITGAATLGCWDRPGLEERVCECYQVVKKESERLFPEVSQVIPLRPRIRTLGKPESNEAKASTSL